ncbi:MAG TPA: hypothetical protein DCE78_05465 [Bacteroidetes bacterium]|nr:hypothetical protein [Bacteroidota bacterium]
MFNSRNLVLIGIVLIVAMLRFLPHPPNFVPIAALAMFGGAYFSNKGMALLIPMGIMLATDALIGFHDTMWVVYLSFMAMVGIGMLVGKKVGFASVTAGALTGSILFYLTTNFAVWAMGSGVFYPLNFEGLMMSYTAAIPFFHYSIAGDLFYSAILFGGFEYAQKRVPALA